MPRNFGYKKSCLLHPKSAYRQHNKKRRSLFWKSAFVHYSILWRYNLWTHLWWYILYYGQKEMSRKTDGNFAENSRNENGTFLSLFTKSLRNFIYNHNRVCNIMQSVYFLRYHYITFKFLCQIQISCKICSIPAQIKCKFRSNPVQIQCIKKQKPISYLKSEFLYDSFYGKDRCNIQAHLWRYLLYYNENEMSTKFNRKFSEILPKPFRRKKNISDLIHKIFTISDKQIQSQRKW